MELWHAMRNLTSFSSLNFCTKAQWAQYYRRPKWEFPFAHHWVYVKGVPCRLYYSIYFWKEYVKTLHAHHSFISICGKPICKIQFADDIDPMAGTDSKLQDLTDTLQMRMERRSSMRRACYDHQQRQSRDWNERSTAERGDQLFIFQSHLFFKDGNCTAEICIRINTATAAGQYLVKQGNKVFYKVQTVQVPCSSHHALQMPDVKSAYWQRGEYRNSGPSA